MDLSKKIIKQIKRGEIKDLRGEDLRDEDLSCSDLRGTDLRCADLRGTDLRCSDLRGVDLSDANLRGADLRDADLRGVDLTRADLRYADLNCSDLRDADLRDADLRDADLRYANLRDIKYNFGTEGYNIACPEKGSFIGYKKAKNCLIELLILDNSKRSSATTLKCRCDKAKVLEIINIETGENINSVSSDYDKNFIYTVGEIVKVDNFDNDRWNECTTGIHFFVNKANAINYK